ncbi:glycosyltransferase family 4 protein [Pedobacter immunditicola]|uniref:glycosyltransferase family 4 protein n=1 Tax=Pedobacter immunditicola TaxID=3133440 RepID=UPI0030B40676
MNVLVLTDVLPAPVLSGKARENDVLMTTAGYHESLEPKVNYVFVFVVSYSNLMLSWVSRKWKELYRFQALGKYEIGGREVVILPVPNFQEDGPFKGLLIKIGYYMNRRKLGELIKKHQIDLVHAHDIKLNAGIAYHLYKDTGMPYVVTTRKLGKLKLNKTLIQYLRRAQAVINLGFSQQALAAPYHQQNYIIPHGIDGRFLAQEKDYGREEQPAPAAPLKIVSLCRLLKWKNIDQVLFALEQLDGDFIYDIYGDGPDLTRLKNILSTLRIREKVNFKGHLPYEQVPQTLVSYDLFVLPSYREMFGRVYIEAMACGLPVIGAKNCGVDGYVENGVEGFLVNHLDIDEIAAAIKKFMNNAALRKTMGENAKALSAEFSWEQIIKKIDAVYRQSLDPASSNSCMPSSQVQSSSAPSFLDPN